MPPAPAITREKPEATARSMRTSSGASTAMTTSAP